jgi:hypothetical protein
MKVLGYVALLLVLIGFTAPAEAAKTNLLTNGSFEQGFTGWEMQGDAQIVTGTCGGTRAALMPSAFLRNEFKMKKHQYKLVFFFIGGLEISVTPGVRHYSDVWTKKVIHFKPEDKGDTLWFMSWNAALDCVKLYDLDKPAS